MAQVPHPANCSSAAQSYLGVGYDEPTRPSLAEDREKLLSQHHRATARPSTIGDNCFKWLTRTRATLRVLSLLFSAAIVAILAWALVRYQATRHATEPTGGTMPSSAFDVWPHALVLRPTYTLMGAGVVGTAVSGAIVLAMFSKKVLWMTSKASNVVTLVASVICTAVFIAIAVYYKLWDDGDANTHDLMSWTSTHQDYEYRDIDFNLFCQQVRFVRYDAIILAVYEVISIVLLAYVMTKRSKARTGYKPV